MLTVLLLATTGCTAGGAGDESATRVLQSVDVGLATDGKIQSMIGTAVYVNDESGESRSEVSNYTPAEVVDDLPVRVTTHYRTDEGSGTDLDELAGYNGRVEIELTLENLLVASENVAYDVAGEARTSPALVGTPLTIAASVTMPKTSPSLVIFDADAQRRTNGVVSGSSDGGSIVQWGALLAPPQSEATATFRLVADVRDFSVPSFDIAVQPGLSTDLSFNGVMASAFDSNPDSDLATQQQAISIVAEVNNVLTKAGTTITEVRKNLNDTSRTLGVRASQRLTDSSTQLTTEMTALGSQITTLDSSLKSSVTGTTAAVNSELSQIVSSLNATLGNTTGTPPKLVDGGSCTAQMKEDEGDGTLFSMFLYLSALLGGYADASEQCRGEILSELDTVIGPELPDDAVCSPASKSSATCALFQGKQSVLTSLNDLVQKGQSIVDGLNTVTVQDGIDAHDELTTSLSRIQGAVTTLSGQASNKQLWQDLLEKVEATQESSVTLGNLHADLTAARSTIMTGGTVYQQQETIAQMLCDLSLSNGGADAEPIEAIRAQIADLRCDGTTPQNSSDVPAGGTSLGQLGDLEADLDAAISVVDVTIADSALSLLNTELSSLHDIIQATIASIDTSTSSFQESVDQLQGLLDEANGFSETVGTKLGNALTEQQSLGQQITETFDQAKTDTENSVNARIDTQIADLNAQRSTSRTELTRSYQSLIDGLRSSANTSLSNGRTAIDGQKAQLEAGKQKATATLDARTVTALESIESSTSASTRNIAAASSLLTDSLNKVLLDLGDPKINGSGILGAMSASAAKSDTADYQLAQASQYASGYANVRGEDIAGILLRNAQFRAALDKTAAFPPFHLELPSGATSQTIYTFKLGGGVK